MVYSKIKIENQFENILNIAYFICVVSFLTSSFAFYTL